MIFHFEGYIDTKPTEVKALHYALEQKLKNGKFGKLRSRHVQAAVAFSVLLGRIEARP